MDSFEAEKRFKAWEIEQELEQLKAQMRNPQAPPPNTKYTPPTSDPKTKNKYLSQEIEEELEQLKAQMRNPQNQTNYTNTKYTPPVNDKNKVFYEILEIKPGAAQDEIKQAYKRLVKKWHPDLFFNNPQLKLQAQEKFKKINEAYKKLSN